MLDNDLKEWIRSKTEKEIFEVLFPGLPPEKPERRKIVPVPGYDEETTEKWVTKEKKTRAAFNLICMELDQQRDAIIERLKKNGGKLIEKDRKFLLNEAGKDIETAQKIQAESMRAIRRTLHDTEITE